MGYWRGKAVVKVSFFNAKDFVCVMKVLYLCHRFNYIFRIKIREYEKDFNDNGCSFRLGH